MANLDDLRKKQRGLAALQRRLRELTKGKGSGDTRQRDAERKRGERHEQRDLTIPPVADAQRRAACEADIFLWLKTYFGRTFSQPFTSQRQEMVRAILTAAYFGGDQAIAAPRGEGKTTIAECASLFCILIGLIHFPLLTAATGPDARRLLDHFKEHLERNEVLAEDYPEVCFPITALAGAPQRAGSQTVEGVRTYLHWGQDYIVLPTVAGSKASGAVIMTRGLDAAIRGIRVGTLRPDLVLIDDPETRESVVSEPQTEKRELTIEQDLAGLGGGDKRLARLMLCTLMRRASLSAKYTDPQLKPSWKGRRFKALEKLPDRVDLWEEYCSMRQQNFRDGDEYARGAHGFYLENRDVMDAGAEIANPANYNAEELGDGTQTEASALQRCYNVIADRGWEHFSTEYQNDPPEETGPIESGITAARIQRQVSGMPRYVVPPGCTVVTHAIDVHKHVLYWIVKAWKPDATAYVIDYDAAEVPARFAESNEAIDEAILQSLFSRREAMLAMPYHDVDGNAVEIGRTLVDARYRTAAVYHFCREAGVAFQPAMGFGKSSGCAQPKFSAPARATTDRRPGDGWFLSRQNRRDWLVVMDTDRWKAWEHDRWMTPPDKPGTCLLYGQQGVGDRLSQDQKNHFRFSLHMCAEVEVEEQVPKKGLVRQWKQISQNNHLLDCAYMADVAANMSGISLLADTRRAEVAKGGWFAAQQSKKKGRRT